MSKAKQNQKTILMQFFKVQQATEDSYYAVAVLFLNKRQTPDIPTLFLTSMRNTKINRSKCSQATQINQRLLQNETNLLLVKKRPRFMHGLAW